MARKQINLTDTFNTWKDITNEVSASVGDLSALSAHSEYTYNFPTQVFANPDFWTGTTPVDFTVTKGDQYEITIDEIGDGYDVGDQIVVRGNFLGGATPAHDMTITVDSVTPDGGIDDYTVTGQPAIELVAELNQLRSEIGAQTLTTTAQDLYGAINELDAIQGDVLNWGTTATTLTGAVKELYTDLGDITAANMGTDATTVETAIKEITDEIGDLDLTAAGDGVDLGTTLTTAVNALKVEADDLQAELGGNMTDYAGSQTTVLNALNSLYAASSISTLDDEYVRRDGVKGMKKDAALLASNGGITAAKGDDPDADDYVGNGTLYFKTYNASDALTNRMVIGTGNGNIGIGQDPGTYKLGVNGSINATTLYYNGQDTDTRYLRIAPATDDDVTDINLDLSLNGTVDIMPTDDNPGHTVTIGGSVIASTVADDEFTPEQWLRDIVGGMFSSDDMTITYNDQTKVINLVVDDDSHNHTVDNIDDFGEKVQDIVGAMVVEGVGKSIQDGISVTYTDNVSSNGFLSFNVDDVEVNIGRTKQEADASTPEEGDVGDVYGTFTITNLGSVEDVDLRVRPEMVRDTIAAFVTTNTGIGVNHNDANNTLTFSNTDKGSAQNIFKSIGVTDATGTASTITATSNSDSFSLTAGTGVDLTVDTNDISFGLVEKDVETIVAAMFNDNWTSGANITFTARDPDNGGPATGQIEFAVDGLGDGDIRLVGDVTGQIVSTATGFEINTTVNTGAVNIDEIRNFREEVRDTIKEYIDVSDSGSGLSKTVTDAVTDQFFLLDGNDVVRVANSGSGGEIKINAAGNSYIATAEPVTGTGSGYTTQDVFKIVGTFLGGSTPTNDLIVRVSAVDNNGAITGMTTEGSPTGETEDKLKLAVTFTPTITVGEGDTVTKANSHISGTGAAGGEAFGMKIKDGVITTDMLASGFSLPASNVGSLTRSNTDASQRLQIKNSSGTVLKTIYGWSS